MAVNRNAGRHRRSTWVWLAAALCLVALWQVVDHGGREVAVDGIGNMATGARDAPARAPAHAFLPPEAFDTLALIDRGGPFPHRQDGGVFQNRERLLPQQPRGHYREYTVATPGARDRGARRIVTGGDPPREWYYTADHYGSFRAFQRTGDTP
ncbi:ribonuclease domain-containing protein [Luteimonas sp. MC1572]|uniref:ribonuclease domain-containing protein n=1 Tax=Luteimonas sp. MC1572 TaxID=2799325 RepID=UPI0018F10465|nr:ribonuclease domain-containing protein [Luteimonas sp. MC1572]MBJ6982022.1 ribonuclease [Luteimonas sp. MC1572]QQO03321.1 ribonuclease [Luteimonas sp. MC1572]